MVSPCVGTTDPLCSGCERKQLQHDALKLWFIEAEWTVDGCPNYIQAKQWASDMKTYKITLKLVRSFSLGFTVMSPKLNGFCMTIDVACFSLQLWSRGEDLFTMSNYWAA